MKRQTAEEIIIQLCQAEADLAQGLTIGQVCQRLAMSEQTLHCWRNQYGGLKADEAKRLKELEAENASEAPGGRAGLGQAAAPGGRPKKW